MFKFKLFCLRYTLYDRLLLTTFCHSLTLPYKQFLEETEFLCVSQTLHKFLVVCSASLVTTIPHFYSYSCLHFCFLYLCNLWLTRGIACKSSGWAGWLFSEFSHHSMQGTSWQSSTYLTHLLYYALIFRLVAHWKQRLWSGHLFLQCPA